MQIIWFYHKTFPTEIKSQLRKKDELGLDLQTLVPMMFKNPFNGNVLQSYISIHSESDAIMPQSIFGKKYIF